jgi:hypothetical protein
MATRKRRARKTRKTSHRKRTAPRTTVRVTNPRRRRRSNPRRHHARRHRNPSTTVVVGRARTRRRHRNGPNTTDLKKLGMSAVIAAIGGFAGVAATTALEGRVAQPPRILGLIKLGLGAAGLYAGAKLKQPLAGIAFAGAVGASAAKDIAGSFTAGATPPQVPAAADPAQMPQNAGGDGGGMSAVLDDDDDLDGAEGMAAVFDGDDDPNGPWSDDDDDFESGDFDRDFLD